MSGLDDPMNPNPESSMPGQHSNSVVKQRMAISRLQMQQRAIAQATTLAAFEAGASPVPTRMTVSKKSAVNIKLKMPDSLRRFDRRVLSGVSFAGMAS